MSELTLLKMTFMLLATPEEKAVLKPFPGRPLWTDDFSNIVSILR